MKTIKEIIESSKCRRGPATGTTKRGAYWLACEPIKVAVKGGDGIGQNAPDVKIYVELRHYRSGEAAAVLYRSAWHQNGSYSGGGDSYERCEPLLACTTVEEVVVVLKNADSYSDFKADEVACDFGALGLPMAAPSPDEVA